MKWKNNKKITIKEVYIVFVKNKDALLWILFIVLLPSSTTLGIESKLESIKTIWLTFLAASLPFIIAILQSASFNARTSFTPSPVIATVWPSFLSIITIFLFSSGLTLPKIVLFIRASFNFLSLFILLKSTYLS